MNKEYNYDDAINNYKNNIDISKMSKETKDIFTSLIDIFDIFRMNQFRMYNKIASLVEQVENMNTLISNNKNIDNNIKEQINKLANTLEPTVDKIIEMNNSISSDEIEYLHYTKGVRYKKIAEQFGLTENQVRQRGYRKHKEIDKEKN